MIDVLDKNRVELPCSKCGNAAVSMVLAGLLDAIGGANKLALKGAARLAGQKIDESHVTYGIEPSEISEVLSLVCIPCVDGARGA